MSEKVQALYINTHNQHAFTVSEQVEFQNMFNATLYSAADKKRADVLKNKLSRLFNCDSYVNYRGSFIAVKVQEGLAKMTARRMEQLIEQVKRNNAELVFTATNGIILRLR